jgi:hypothetical protein
MQLRGNGLYTALLIKVLAYLLGLRLKAQKHFSNGDLTAFGRKWTLAGSPDVASGRSFS